MNAEIIRGSPCLPEHSDDIQNPLHRSLGSVFHKLPGLFIYKTVS